MSEVIRPGGTVTASCLVLAVLGCLGCQPSPSPRETGGGPQGATGERTPSRVTKSKLKTINVAYHNFCASYDRAPRGIDEFAPFLVSTVFPESRRRQEEECLRQLKQGTYVVVWNLKGTFPAKDGTDIVTAYEKRAAESGGFVVFANGRVEWMTPAELKRPTHQAQ